MATVLKGKIGRLLPIGSTFEIESKFQWRRRYYANHINLRRTGERLFVVKDQRRYYVELLALVKT